MGAPQTTRSSPKFISTCAAARLACLFLMRTITCAGIWIATVICLPMAAGSWSTITLGRRKRPRFALRLTRSGPKVASFRLDTTEGARGTAGGDGYNFGDRGDRSALAAWFETT